MRIRRMPLYQRFFIFLLLLILAGAAYYQLWFLRQPERNVPVDPSVFVSPANGKVAAVVHWYSDSLAWEKDAGVVQVLTKEIGPEGYLIAIEMDVTNVHYQRAPAAGRLIGGSYTEGKFNNALIMANRFGLRLENERNDLLFEMKNGPRYKVVQVAGLLARRIVDYVEPGQSVEQGEVIGLIKLGSQVGLVFPIGAEPLVKAGDTVVDGETVLARLAVE